MTDARRSNKEMNKREAIKEKVEMKHKARMELVPAVEWSRPCSVRLTPSLAMHGLYCTDEEALQSARLSETAQDWNRFFDAAPDAEDPDDSLALAEIPVESSSPEAVTTYTRCAYTYRLSTTVLDL